MENSQTGPYDVNALASDRSEQLRQLADAYPVIVHLARDAMNSKMEFIVAALFFSASLAASVAPEIWPAIAIAAGVAAFYRFTRWRDKVKSWPMCLEIISKMQPRVPPG